MFGCYSKWIHRTINKIMATSTEAEFPAVTICNLNPLRKSKLVGTAYQELVNIDVKYGDDLEKSGATYHEFKGHKNGPDNAGIEDSSDEDDPNDAAQQNDKAFQAVMLFAETDDYSDMTDLLKPTKEDLDAYGHQAQDFIMQCSFDKTNCSYLDFTKVYNSRHGNCFVFNHNATRTSLYGSKYGLRLTLNVESNEYVGLFSHEVGVRVAVHAANVTAFPEDEGVNAPTELSTSIGVTTSTFTRLPAPYTSMCADGSNHTLLDEGEYTVWSCNLACLQSNLKKECGCSDRVGQPASESMCSLTNKTQDNCRGKIYYRYRKGTLMCYCPQPCNQVQYNSKVSMTTWPSDSYTPILWDKIGDKLRDLGYTTVYDARDTLARIHVYMEDLTVHSTEEYAAYTVEHLFANMGGYLGLFIGISACTMMEFFEFLMDAMGYAAVTLCGGCFVRCVQRDNNKTGLPVSSTPIEVVKLPPPETGLNTTTNTFPSILIVEPKPDAQ